MKADLEWCITSTNSVIHRWRNSKNCPEIVKDDVYQILFGYLRKRVITNKNQFKELKRRLYVAITKEGYIKYISIAISDIEKNHYNNLTDSQMLSIDRNLRSIDYDSLIYPYLITDIELSRSGVVTDQTPELLNISFETIKSINF